MRYISELHEGDMVSEVFLCKTKTSGTSKFGKTYYSLSLQDKTGMIDGKVWELNNAIGHFEAMDYIMVKGNDSESSESVPERTCHEGFR